ncbi:hypothetical protein SISNIDRAFT_291047 [Sistotremastrum niveocremeum HHB9708]|uniref:Uncharacterized protein n=1 Tax=Sistotremastrum niveocremeum HHB9708 TaxID=1314777 RepID=A0A164YIX9_9AGAM|nr:hypothetical protein SISNIDRAFT_291047 [Sistotremastrum niveocremeum HHB9708]
MRSVRRLLFFLYAAQKRGTELHFWVPDFVPIRLVPSFSRQNRPHNLHCIPLNLTLRLTLGLTALFRCQTLDRRADFVLHAEKWTHVLNAVFNLPNQEWTVALLHLELIPFTLLRSTLAITQQHIALYGSFLSNHIYGPCPVVSRRRGG